MSGPSFENIDRWLFEYVEGNLTHEQEKQLEAFLLDHPELDMDLDSWQMAKVEPISVEFPNQESLYREEKKRRRILPYLIGGSAIMTLFIIAPLLLMNSEENIITKENNKVAKAFQVQNKNLAKNDKEILNSGGKNPKSTFSTNTGVNTAKINQLSSSYAIKNELIASSSSKKTNEIPRIVLVENQPNSIVEFNEIDSVVLPNKIIKIESEEILSENSELKEVDSLNSKEHTLENVNSNPNDKKSIDTDKKKVVVSSSLNPKITLKKLVKDLNNFVGNEIGLKNTRDHQIHIPGLSQLDANFSSAGDISSTRFRSISRAQWLGKENQSLTNQLALDWYSKPLKSGFGIQGNYQVYGNGVIQNWNTAFIYSPKILLSKSFLIEPGIRFKMGSKILTSNLVNTNKVEVERDNAIDFYADGSTPIGTNQWYRDLGASLLIHSKWFFIGAQADNLLRHQDNIYSNSITNPRRAGIYYSVNLGTEYESKTGDLSFSPYGYYEKFENREEAWGGFNFQYKTWSVGGALSNKSNFALSTGLRFATFALTYQFDRTFSSLLGSSASSHQLTLMFNTKVSRSSRRYIQLK